MSSRPELAALTDGAGRSPEWLEWEVTAPVTKRCPFVEEVDEGEVTIRWRGYRGIELHSLAAYLASFADEPLSHEDFAAKVTAAVAAAVQREGNVDVTGRWTTAGMAVSVSCSI